VVKKPPDVLGPFGGGLSGGGEEAAGGVVQALRGSSAMEGSDIFWSGQRTIEPFPESREVVHQVGASLRRCDDYRDEEEVEEGLRDKPDAARSRRILRSARASVTRGSGTMVTGGDACDVAEAVNLSLEYL
jgi:hypothetical protein